MHCLFSVSPHGRAYSSPQFAILSAGHGSPLSASAEGEGASEADTALHVTAPVIPAVIGHCKSAAGRCLPTLHLVTLCPSGGQRDVGYKQIRKQIR